MAVLLSIAAFDPNLELNLFGALRIQLKYIAALYVIFDFVSLRLSDNTGGNLAHLGGALYGFAWGRRMKNGTSGDSFIVAILNKIQALFSKRKMNVVKGGRRDGKLSDEEFALQKKINQQRVDQILDKIGRSGYDSLSKEEKEFLFRYSQK